MEQVKDDLNIATIAKTQANTRTRNYQKYFNVSATVNTRSQVKTIAYNRAKVVLITMYCVLVLLIALVITNFILMSTLSISMLVGCNQQSSDIKKVAIIQLVEHTSLNTIKDAFDAQMEELGQRLLG